MSNEDLWGKLIPNREMPALHIVIMICGTHGDVLPFVGFAHALQDRGHRVRIATHATHQHVVEDRGIEYYQIAGNPKQLSEFMVQTGGSIMGGATRMDLVKPNLAMVKDILKSTWPACTDPGNSPEGPFTTDLIISNPPTNGHIHVAEALGVPLHIMFPQPWYYGTKSFPHPMVGLSYADRNRAEQNFANTNSYAAFEAIQFQPLKKAVNKWRKKELNLPPIQGHSMSTTLPDLKIPFSAMWSPSFVPKPDDWPEQCRVVGTFNFKERATNTDGDEPTPAPKFDPIAAGLGEADEWLRQEGAGKPVFIGFGSMVIENPEKLQEIITSAAAEVGCRIIVQSGWTNIDVSNCKNAEDLDKQLDFTGPLCQNIGRCPHDWLLPLCSAVVHHGGAGTTAAGLKHSLPTFVCPFFADQYMWSEMVARANVGPSPCPVKDLTKDILVERLKELTSDALKENAIKLSREMHEENGIEGGLSHLMDGVPVHNMFCDVNMLLGIVKRAHHRVVGTKIKLSDEVAAALEAVKISWSSEPLGVFRVSGLRLEQINIVDYNTVGNVQNCTHGMMYGITGCFFNTLDALLMWFTVPNRWSYRKGMCGCIFGVLWFPFKTFFRLLYACWFLLDAFLLGAYNQCAKNDREWIILPVRKSELSRVNNLSFVEERKSKILQDGFEGEDFNRLLSGYEFVKHARCAFNASSPVRSEEHKCYLVKVVDLIPAIGKIEVFESSDEKEEAIECLKECKSEKVTFTEICRILSPVVGRRINVHLKSRSRKSIFDIYNDESNDEENQSPLINRVGTGSLEKHDTVKRLIREKSRMVL